MNLKCPKCHKIYNSLEDFEENGICINCQKNFKKCKECNEPVEPSFWKFSFGLCKKCQRDWFNNDIIETENNLYKNMGY